MADRQLVPEATLEVLRAGANAADNQAHWPDTSWNALCQGGVLGWCIPPEFGGQGRGAVELLEGYAALASACLTTAFFLSQREGACRRIIDSGSEVLCRELLPALASGERFATIGLSQLTTSRQHVKPVLLARLSENSLVLDGTIPWVTGAERADHFIIGAALEDGRQVLVVVPRQSPGLTVGPPFELMALQGSLTAEVRCNNVVLERRWLLAGPVEGVMASGRGGTGGVETSCLALGLTRAAVEHVQQEAVHRPDLRPIAERLERARQDLWTELLELGRGGSTPEAAAVLRGRANSLVLQATQTALTVSKGTGFLRPHPAQRWARQAMFFLVWSCPRPAAEATLAFLAPPENQVCL